MVHNIPEYLFLNYQFKVLYQCVRKRKYIAPSNLSEFFHGPAKKRGKKREKERKKRLPNQNATKKNQAREKNHVFEEISLRSID